jgi:anti-sigma factor RsiW
VTDRDLERRIQHMRDTHGGLTCAEFDAFIRDYAESSLSPAQAALFNGHMAACPGCARYLEQYQRASHAAHATADDGPPPDAPPELVDAILAALGKR